jgi:putative transcriptional regulator
VAWTIGLTEVYHGTGQKPTAYLFVIFLSVLVVSTLAQSAGILIGYWRMKTGMPEITNNIRGSGSTIHEMTQEDLAKAVGLHAATIIALEQGKYVPSIELALRYPGFRGQPWKSFPLSRITEVEYDYKELPGYWKHSSSLFSSLSVPP